MSRGRGGRQRKLRQSILRSRLRDWRRDWLRDLHWGKFGDGWVRGVLTGVTVDGDAKSVAAIGHDGNVAAVGVDQRIPAEIGECGLLIAIGVDEGGAQSETRDQASVGEVENEDAKMHISGGRLVPGEFAATGFVPPAFGRSDGEGDAHGSGTGVTGERAGVGEHPVEDGGFGVALLLGQVKLCVGGVGRSGVG